MKQFILKIGGSGSRLNVSAQARPRAQPGTWWFSWGVAAAAWPSAGRAGGTGLPMASACCCALPVPLPGKAARNNRDRNNCFSTINRKSLGGRKNKDLKMKARSSRCFHSQHISRQLPANLSLSSLCYSTSW